MIRELTYCTNVHPGESLEELLQNLEGPVRDVADGFSPNNPFPLGLWLPHESALRLWNDSKLIDAFRENLQQWRMIPITLNVFPYGGFHAERVKERVYSPSWLDEDRLRYTCMAGDVFAQLLDDGGFGTMSTLAGAHRPLGRDENIQRVIAENLRGWVEHAHSLFEEGGKTLALALEPEPWTTFETMFEMARFLGDTVFRLAENVWSKTWGVPPSVALERVQRHLGVCFDLCHQAVLFEDPFASVRALVDAAIPIHKVQISNALQVDNPQDAESIEALMAFDEPRFLHQSAIRRRDGSIQFVSDLPELRSALLHVTDANCIRTHFHVPLYKESFGCLGTTRDTIPQFLSEILNQTTCRHFEVETYTFSVLPSAELEAVKQSGLSSAIVRELEWASLALQSGLLSPES